MEPLPGHISARRRRAARKMQEWHEIMRSRIGTSGFTPIETVTAPFPGQLPTASNHAMLMGGSFLAFLAKRGVALEISATRGVSLRS